MPPPLLPLMRPLIAVPVALRAANTIMGLMVMQGITMSMWRGMLNRVSRPNAVRTCCYLCRQSIELSTAAHSLRGHEILATSAYV